MLTSEKIDLISSAIVDLQSQICNIKSTSENPFFHSKYADLSTIIQTVRPLLAEHRLAIVQGCEGQTLTTRLIHESGQWIESCLDLSVPKWADPQKVGAAITYARRYEQAAILNIAQTDDDGNMLAKEANKAPEFITSQQAFDLQAGVEAVGDVGKFCKAFKVNSIGEMTTDIYPKALEMLKAKQALDNQDGS